MAKPHSYPYLPIENRFGEQVWRPYLPISLRYRQNETHATGLVDSGSDVNLLPYQMGVDLGANWQEQRVAFSLSGNQAGVRAKGLLLDVAIGDFRDIKLAFAWAEADHLPVILGQTNFFQNFAVCFLNSSGYFTIESK